MGTLSSHPPTSSYTSLVMRSLLASVLISVTWSLPSQLGRQNGYVAPVNTYIAAAPVTTYQPAAPASVAVPVVAAPVTSYQPAAPASVAVPVVTAPVTTYQPAARASVAAPVAVAKTPVVGIRSQSFQPSGNGAFRYAFDTENDITASAEGSVKTVDDTEVVVMKGEYSYVGSDGNTWKVEWFADETGFHPTAPFLPKSVQPNHPEVAAAVKAQLAFAAQEARTAPNTRINSYTSPLPGYSA